MGLLFWTLPSATFTWTGLISFGSAPACALRSRASIMDGTPPTLPYLTSVHGYMLSVVVVEPTYVRPGLSTGKFADFFKSTQDSNQGLLRYSGVAMGKLSH